jgi:CDP-paratose 2-epimerase
VGRQVRDVLHPDDVFALLSRQLEALDRCSGSVYNAGGGRERSVSLSELTALCREAAGREVEVRSDPRTSPVDVPLYVTDHAKATRELGWRPTWAPADIVGAIARWVGDDEARLRAVFT